MPVAINIVDLRRMLSERFPEAHQRRRSDAGESFPTGVPALDRLLDGGLPKGVVTELVGVGPGSGTAQVLHSLLTRTAQDGHFLALVDGADSFDIDAATPEALERLLWIRCRNADEALKAGDLVLRDRNLPLVVLDLKLNPGSQLHRISASVWHRLERIAEHNGTTLLVITPFPLVTALNVRIEARAGLDIGSLAVSPRELWPKLSFVLQRASRTQEKAQNE